MPTTATSRRLSVSFLTSSLEGIFLIGAEHLVTLIQLLDSGDMDAIRRVCLQFVGELVDTSQCLCQVLNLFIVILLLIGLDKVHEINKLYE